MSRARTIGWLASVLVVGLGLGAGVGLTRGRGSPRGAAVAAGQASPAATGWPLRRRVPRLALVDARGRATSLGAFRGRVVVLAPSLTLCHEVCPLTTGAFLQMRRSAAAAGLAGRVAFVEATVDPWRDSPARLRAYQRLVGAQLPMLTGSVGQVRRLWRFFGIGFRRVPQGRPPDVDWWTHRPEAFDVVHVDGVFIIDRRGRERAFFPGVADVDRRLGPALRELLSAEGRANLSHPGDAWTIPRVLAAVGRLLHRPIPAAA